MSNPDKNVVFFKYEDEDISLVACGSRRSGKEWVTANGDVVSEKRNMRRNSIHSFEYGDHAYVVKYSVQSILKGVLRCEISKDKNVVKKYEATYLLGGGPAPFVIFVLFGVISAFVVEDPMVFFALLALLVAVTVGFYAVKARKMEQYFEIKELAI